MYTSMMAATGFDPAQISSLVGHTGPSCTLRRSTHALGPQRQRAAATYEPLMAIDRDAPVDAP